MLHHTETGNNARDVLESGPPLWAATVERGRMTNSGLRLGIVGAGTIFREMHLPILRRIADVSIQAVANCSRTSARLIADKYEILNIEEHWQTLVTRSDVDAVMIGTPPDLQAEIAVAALCAGKHVFCEPPMGRNLADAQRMLAVANSYPKQVSVVCHTTRRRPNEGYVEEIIKSGEVGQITAVDVLNTSDIRMHRDAVHWRERSERCGRLILALDAYTEVLNAWVGPYASLGAVTTIPIKEKLDLSGTRITLDVPQIVMISGLLENGAAGVEYHGGLSPDKSTPRDLVTIYGLKGVLRYYFDTGEIKLAGIGGDLQTIEAPAQYCKPLRPELDFVEALRFAMAGNPWASGTNLTFRAGADVMRKLEAVHCSAATERFIHLSSL
jgi:predicted dehydrogenase